MIGPGLGQGALDEVPGPPAVAGPVDGLFNVAGVSSGIRNPLLVVTINFLGTRKFTEGLIPQWRAGTESLAALRIAAGLGFSPAGTQTTVILD